MEKLNFVGIGGALAIELGGNCCFIKNNDNLLIIDACEDATKKLLAAGAFDNVKNIYIAITHTHYDHIAGLGVLIWYSSFNLNIVPQIIYNDEKYKETISELLKITGVNDKLFSFVLEDTLNFDFSINMQPTTHSPSLQCFGILFEDEFGKYYYTGDTNDIDYVRKLANDSSVKTIYCEVSEETYDVHIKYDDILDLDKGKLVLMHFNTSSLYERAKQDGFSVAKLV